MVIAKSFKLNLLWHFGKSVFIQSLLISSIAVFLFRILKIEYVAIPFLPVATIGTAVAFYMDLKTIKHTIDYGKQGRFGAALQIQVEILQQCYLHLWKTNLLHTKFCTVI